MSGRYIGSHVTVIWPKEKLPCKKLYRYDDGHTDKELRLQEFDIVKETPKGFFIEFYQNKNNKKWVPKLGVNIFAWETKEKALFNYIKRKEKQIEILKYKTQKAATKLEIAKKIDLKPKLLEDKR
jgi:hypothetical protein